MAHVDELTAQAAAQTLGTDVFYIGREGDADPDRQMLVSEALVLFTVVTFGADDTTGASVTEAAPYYIPAGIWYAYQDDTSSGIEVYVNGGWRRLAVPGNATADWLGAYLVFSDGTNARATTIELAEPAKVYLRRVSVGGV